MTKQEEFINTIGPIIQKEAADRGYKIPSAIIAQACLESAYGASTLSSVYFNYFGMKCGSSWKGKSVNFKTKEEYTAGTLTTIRDNFRVYDSMEEGVKGYFDFISTKRYENLKDATSPMIYLGRIKADGYATSSSYVGNCMKVVDAYNLTRFDIYQVYIKPVTPQLISDIIDGKYGNGQARKSKLTAEGYNYDDVRAKINELDKIGSSFATSIKSKTDDYYICVLKLMLLKG